MSSYLIYTKCKVSACPRQPTNPASCVWHASCSPSPCLKHEIQPHTLAAKALMSAANSEALVFILFFFHSFKRSCTLVTLAWFFPGYLVLLSLCSSDFHFGMAFSNFHLILPDLTLMTSLSWHLPCLLQLLVAPFLLTTLLSLTQTFWRISQLFTELLYLIVL